MSYRESYLHGCVFFCLSDFLLSVVDLWILDSLYGELIRKCQPYCNDILLSTSVCQIPMNIQEALKFFIFNYIFNFRTDFFLNVKPPTKFCGRAKNCGWIEWNVTFIAPSILNAHFLLLTHKDWWEIKSCLNFNKLFSSYLYCASFAMGIFSNDQFHGQVCQWPVLPMASISNGQFFRWQVMPIVSFTNCQLCKWPVFSMTVYPVASIANGEFY